MKELLKAGLINGGCLTVTGQTVAENLAATPTVADLDEQVSPIPVLHGMETQL